MKTHFLTLSYNKNQNGVYSALAKTFVQVFRDVLLGLNHLILKHITRTSVSITSSIIALAVDYSSN